MRWVLKNTINQLQISLGQNSKCSGYKILKSIAETISEATYQFLCFWFFPGFLKAVSPTFPALWTSTSSSSGSGGGGGAVVIRGREWFHTHTPLAEMELCTLACSPATCADQFPTGCGPAAVHGLRAGDPCLKQFQKSLFLSSAFLKKCIDIPFLSRIQCLYDCKFLLFDLSFGLIFPPP